MSTARSLGRKSTVSSDTGTAPQLANLGKQDLIEAAIAYQRLAAKLVEYLDTLDNDDDLLDGIDLSPLTRSLTNGVAFVGVVAGRLAAASVLNDWCRAEFNIGRGSLQVTEVA